LGALRRNLQAFHRLLKWFPIRILSGKAVSQMSNNKIVPVITLAAVPLPQAGEEGEGQKS
jgi:hypothetical protein